MGLNQKRDSLRVSVLSIEAVNSVLTRIERRLDQTEGVGQNADMHGGRITNLQSGSRDKEALSTNNVGDELVYLDNNILTVRVKADQGLDHDASGLFVEIKADEGIGVSSDGISTKRKTGYGIDCDTDGLKLKQQPAIGNPSAVTAVVAGAGADTIDMAGLNTDLATLATEINALKDVVQDILDALRLGEEIAT